MAKKGMSRTEQTHTKPKNEQPPVPELQGKAKHSNEKAAPVISGSVAPPQKAYHTVSIREEKPISSAYAVIDNDLARDNMENDIPAADLQDL